MVFHLNFYWVVVAVSVDSLFILSVISFSDEGLPVAFPSNPHTAAEAEGPQLVDQE